MNNRIWILLGLVYAVLLLFVGRLWQLQVIQYEQYATRSQGNYLRTEASLAPRGRILDRNGKVIATNRLAVDLKYKGGDILFKDRVLALIGLKELPKVKGEPVDLMVNVPEALIPTLAELTAGEPNLQLVERMERVYPNPIAGPVIGYTALPSPEQVKDGYDPAELVGAAGLEAALEPYLRGTKGIRLSEVNARGQRVRVEEIKPPVAGQDVRLTLDLNLQRVAQKAAQEALDDINRVRSQHGLPTVTQARGAIVAVNPENGEVLAMVTNPAFDPNLFGRRPRPIDQIKALFTDKYQPTLNRAVLPYAPGSTYKLVTSSMLLEDGYVTANTTFNCTPYIVFGGIRRNWSPRNWGPFTVKEAIAQSCNTWYYQAALLDPIGMVDKLAKRANELGVGRPTGLEIAEGTGLIPTLEWKRRTNKAEPTWYPGETLSIFIGQGSNQVTPVQIARMLSTIVENGRQPEFHLVYSIGNQVKAPRFTQVSGTHWQDLKDGMRKTVTWGTAQPLLGNFPVPTGGKTGTAETPGKKLGNEHGWYMGYGPTDPSDPHPPLVVVAFFENSGGGYDVALPAVKKVMSAYWNLAAGEASR
ncbi:penicillin-binding transpeptidase domain-containing protein [Meiothermus granaticius]|uniref:Peptidoglycan D,D-transpeptidase MrdA n=1 Tax=Meiothermus granaticius NBRC 107808 TaxID=1227551 RepID=A0A399F9I6_9DEIN|nr:penicillin-binding transpeptidase domain-containing protein [Meiothermus granaticius]MCL6525905.1 penicillin-binding protein [Thermaceae bacterium]RIH91919.1 Peptidoglycan D,D-transpeptidase MrdA [Meiothermus granaticius NBRC 107808]GEM85461.1 penicillin-binding protein 2 [Meiothermus granaticius NBRC 107808]